ncbi:pyridoxamine 5'-phosphate oxidase family protein [Kitasatospora sp. GP82]|uniref:helix-turn-helix domain-containing protein n=1 Tax=Kitasatospora sp. GP82 TaxID=3035089 RepID=UPI002474DB38|nr:pyridoxamine 5'-phosphate oxidase family protein [Kitasatospora sp. GP82]MDH6124034.1 transcriptional regulator with XRE-family HTH domain [Kitasatospora sp. GP82]
MNENAESTPVRAAQEPDQGAIAQRIAQRRAQLGLTEQELAAQAGMAPRYLRYLTETGPGFDPAGLLRIAAVLRLTCRELLEGRSDAPPGQSTAATPPVLLRLGTPECWEKLGTHGIGRIALPVDPGPAVFPVNYLVDDGTVVYRTDPTGSAAAAAGSRLSFEADRIDEHMSSGWSVLVVGTVEHITDPETIERLSRAPGCEPWAGGNRPLWVRIRPSQITGRRIATAERGSPAP